MKIQIKNFGPIKEVDVDLSKDLTILYGKNNIGKSYAISLVYLILKHFLNIDRLSFEKLARDKVFEKKYRAIEDRIRKEKECDITGEIIEILKNILNMSLSSSLENSLKSTFYDLNDLKNYKSQKKPLIRITLAHFIISFSINDTIIIKKLSMKMKTIGIFTKKKTSIYTNKDKDIIYISDDIPNISEFFTYCLGVIANRISYDIKNAIPGIYFLPAFRSGIYSGSQWLFPMLAELSKKRALITEKIELPRIPEPTADYILHLSEIRSSGTGNKKLGKIARYLEKNILKGEVDFDDEKKRLTYQPANSELVLDISSVSSMVSELSTITAFIKFVLPQDLENKDGEISKPTIFIEEPEAHLHPEVQVKLVEFFLMLLKAGVKLILTSHSNYIFNKLNNMILNRAFDYNTFAPILLQETRTGSVGKLLKTDDLGVDDENFMETADSLYEERENILDRLNDEADDQ
ncbi:MAG: AAA family ATPase [Candidatus Aminicenantes bacterium]|nr:AAA family ATPase [Candidatus Aminicenantes bacterium]